MPALYKFERGFALAHAAFSLYQYTNAKDLDQCTVQQRLRGQRRIEKIGKDIDELACAVAADKYRYTVSDRIRDEIVRRGVVVGKYDAGNGVIKIAFERFDHLFGGHAADKGMLPLTKNLNAVVREVFEKTIERKPRTINVDLAQLTIEIGVRIDKPDLQPIRALQQFSDFD